MINLEYTAASYDPFSENIPAGNYRVNIQEITEKTSKGGNLYLSFKFRILEGTETGKLLFDTINLYHPKEIVKIIAKKKLDGIAYALGLQKITHTQELLNRPMQVRVKEKEGKSVIAKFYKNTDTVPTEKKNPIINHQPQIDVKAHDAPVGPPSPLSTPDDDDIPF